MPGRPTHHRVARPLSRRYRSLCRRRGEAARSAHSRAPRSRAAPLSAARRGPFRVFDRLQLPNLERDLSQSGERPAHDQGRLPRHRGRFTDRGGQARGAEGHLRPAPQGGPESAGRAPDPALHQCRAQAGEGVRLAPPPPPRLSGSAGIHEGKDDGDALFRSGQSREQSRLRRVDLRERGGSLPAGKRRPSRCGALDRPHRLRHPRPAPRHPEEKGSRPAPSLGGDRSSEARRDVLERRERTLQQRLRLQGDGTRLGRRRRDPDR